MGVSVQSRLEEKTGRQSVSASFGDSTMTKSKEKYCVMLLERASRADVRVHVVGKYWTSRHRNSDTTVG